MSFSTTNKISTNNAVNDRPHKKQKPNNVSSSSSSSPSPSLSISQNLVSDQHNTGKKKLSSFILPDNQQRTGNAIVFIRYDPHRNTYAVTEEAKTFLRSVKGPLGVISIAGKYRTGKSFLMDHLLRWRGFGVGHTVHACTTGLMIAPFTVQCQTPNGELFQSIIMDTEGLFSLEADETRDTRIFALTLLLSTMFMYNSSGSIDKSALNNLSLVTNISKWIRVNSSSSSSSSSLNTNETDNINEHFPHFLWLVRDFSLKLSPAHSHSDSTLQSSATGISTSNEFASHYLENALTHSSSPPREDISLMNNSNNSFSSTSTSSALSSCSASVSEQQQQQHTLQNNPIHDSNNNNNNNNVGETIQACFSKRCCMTFVRPANDDNLLQRLDRLSDDELKPEFVQQVNELRYYLTTHTPPKTAFGKLIGGETLARLAELFCKSINEGNSIVIVIVCVVNFMCFQNLCIVVVVFSVEKIKALHLSLRIHGVCSLTLTINLLSRIPLTIGVAKNKMRSVEH